MQFLVDANLPRRLCHWLTGLGHQCDHVLDLGLGQASDEVIWVRATQIDTVIVTKDQDFADRVTVTRTGPAVVWLRTGNGATVDLIAMLTPMMPTIEARLASGDRLVELRQ
ncbi:MAG: DUF5615 family PIN-like protein [Caulobacteraceae bacterium]